MQRDSGLKPTIQKIIKNAEVDGEAIPRDVLVTNLFYAYQAYLIQWNCKTKQEIVLRNAIVEVAWIIKWIFLWICSYGLRDTLGWNQTQIK